MRFFNAEASMWSLPLTKVSLSRWGCATLRRVRLSDRPLAVPRRSARIRMQGREDLLAGQVARGAEEDQGVRVGLAHGSLSRSPSFRGRFLQESGCLSSRHGTSHGGLNQLCPLH